MEVRNLIRRAVVVSKVSFQSLEVLLTDEDLIRVCLLRKLCSSYAFLLDSYQNVEEPHVDSSSERRCAVDLNGRTCQLSDSIEY